MDITSSPSSPSSPALSPEPRGIINDTAALHSFRRVFFLLPLWSLQSQAPTRTRGPDLLGGDRGMLIVKNPS
jgi:hypothetical protein